MDVMRRTGIRVRVDSSFIDFPSASSRTQIQKPEEIASAGSEAASSILGYLLRNYDRFPGRERSDSDMKGLARPELCIFLVMIFLLR